MGHQKSRGGTFLETPQSFPSRPSSFIEVFGYWSELVRTHTHKRACLLLKRKGKIVISKMFSRTNHFQWNKFYYGIWRTLTVHSIEMHHSWNYMDYFQLVYANDFIYHRDTPSRRKFSFNIRPKLLGKPKIYLSQRITFISPTLCV